MRTWETSSRKPREVVHNSFSAFGGWVQRKPSWYKKAPSHIKKGGGKKPGKHSVTKYLPSIYEVQFPAQINNNNHRKNIIKNYLF